MQYTYIKEKYEFHYKITQQRTLVVADNKIHISADKKSGSKCDTTEDV